MKDLTIYSGRRTQNPYCEALDHIRVAFTTRSTNIGETLSGIVSRLGNAELENLDRNSRVVAERNLKSSVKKILCAQARELAINVIACLVIALFTYDFAMERLAPYQRDLYPTVYNMPPKWELRQLGKRDLPGFIAFALSRVIYAPPILLVTGLINAFRQIEATTEEVKSIEDLIQRAIQCAKAEMGQDELIAKRES